MQGGFIMSFCTGYYFCLLQFDLCTDDAVNVGMYQVNFEDYAHGEFVSDENSEGHIVEFDVGTHDGSDRP